MLLINLPHLISRFPSTCFKLNVPEHIGQSCTSFNSHMSAFPACFSPPPPQVSAHHSTEPFEPFEDTQQTNHSL